MEKKREISGYLFVVLMLCSSVAIAAGKPLVVGVTPFMGPIALYERFSPLSSYLADQLGREVLLDTVKTPGEFLQKIYQHEYDLIFTTPVIALRALDDNYYVSGVISDKKSQPLLMVRAQSFIEHPEQLSLKKVGLPPNASSINFMAESWFLSKGVKRAELPQFINFNSHAAAYQATLSGEIDAAFVASFAVKQLRKKLPILRVIDSADYLPGSSILYSSSLDSDLRQRLTNLMVKLKKSPQGREVLNGISMPPFRRLESSEYEVMRPFIPEISSAD